MTDRALLTVFDVLASIITLGSTAFTIRVYPRLPAQVATHFGLFSGAPNRYGPKPTIFILHVVQVFLIIVTNFVAGESFGTPNALKTVVFVGIESIVIIAALVGLQRGFLDVALGKRKTLRGGLPFVLTVFGAAAIAAIAANRVS